MSKKGKRAMKSCPCVDFASYWIMLQWEDVNIPDAGTYLIVDYSICDFHFGCNRRKTLLLSISEKNSRIHFRISSPMGEKNLSYVLPRENYIFNSLWKLLLSLGKILKELEDVQKYRKTRI